MKFEEFKESLSKVKKLALPGEEIHLKMAPIERILELKQKAINREDARKAGVMALFYPDVQANTRLILILRKTYKGVHSGQVGFPGGKQEPEDQSLLETALREIEEEVGVSRTVVEVVKTLTEIYIPPSNFFVQPFIGITEVTPRFVAEEKEVEALIEVPLSLFLDDSILITKTLSTSYAKNIEVPAFYLNEYVVWGATAMILNEVRLLLKQAT